MTAEEAIATLKANYPDACYEQLREAVDAAIAALKKPEIIHCRDCEKYGTKFCEMDTWTEEVTIRRAKPDDFCSSRAERKKE